jgi:hypothetical protein
VIATYWNSLKEAMNRRILVVLVGIAIVTACLMNVQVGFATVNGVKVIVLAERNQGPWPISVPLVLGQQMVLAGYLWMLLTILAACPLLVATFDKGWLELVFSKGVARSPIMLGRFLSGATLYFLLAIIATMPLAIRLWWVTEVPTWQVVLAVLIETLSFASILAVSALASLLQRGVALPVITGLGVWYLSPLLAARVENYYPYVQSEAIRRLIDWLYYILPKNAELDRLATTFIQFSSVSVSWPLWTTVLFTICILALAMGLLERKSF